MAKVKTNKPFHDFGFGWMSFLMVLDELSTRKLHNLFESFSNTDKFGFSTIRVSPKSI